jgi:hypothetical protein
MLMAEINAPERGTFLARNVPKLRTVVLATFRRTCFCLT